MQTLIQGVSGQEVHLAGSLVNRITGARLTSSATARVCVDGTWGDAAGTLAVEETDQYKYTLHDDEAAASELVIAVDHADAVEPIVQSYDLHRNTTWHVDGSNGDDSNLGTLESPLATIQEALDRAADGDTVLVADGTYAEQLSVSQTGLTIEGTGSSAEIADAVSEPDNLLNLNHHCTLRGIKVNNTDTGVGVACLAKRSVTIEDCEIIGQEDGIIATGSYGFRLLRSTVTGTFDGITVSGAHQFLIDGCEINTDGTWTPGGHDARAVYAANATGRVKDSTLESVVAGAFSGLAAAIQMADGGSPIKARPIMLDNVKLRAEQQHASSTGAAYGIANETNPLHFVMLGGSIETTNAGSGDEYHVEASTAGSDVTLHGVSFDATKLNGASNIKTILSPTTPQRTLDVAATGEVGLDFANINQATGATTLNNISLAGSVNSVVGNVGGSVNSVVGNVGGNVVGFVSGVTGNVSGRVLGNGATAFAGVGVRADNRDGEDIAATGDAMALTSGERSTLAAQVESVLVNDGDATALLQAIADKFVTDFDIEDLTLTAIASAVAANPSIAQLILDAAASKTAAESADDKLPNDFETLFSDLRFEVETVDGNVNDIKIKTDLLDFTGTAGALKSESTNMRGTDGANTVTPDNAGIAAAQTAAESAATTATAINTKIGTPQTTLADDIGDIQAGGVTIPVIQVPVPLPRTWILKHTGDGLRGELPLVRSIGESQLMAIDWRADLANNGRLISLDDIQFVGTMGGIVIDSLDQGVDRSQCKFSVECVTAGEYTITAQVTFDDSDGGGTSIGEVTLIVK